MWKTKGTGGLDPYPGLVAMADFLFCRTGPNKTDRKKSLTVKFRNIKKDFWWFKKYPTELYLQMLIDPEYRIADTVEYTPKIYNHHDTSLTMVDTFREG